MIKHYARWTKEEDALLGTMPDEKLVDLLGRSIGAIKGRRQALRVRLDVGVPGSKIVWTDERRSVLGTQPDEELAVLWKVPVSRVSRHRQGLGILQYPAEVNKELFGKELRICSICDECKPLGCYNRHPEGRQGYSAQCRTCRNVSQRRHFRELKRAWVQKMGGRCARCGYDEFSAGLVFHHVGDKDDRWRLRFLGRPSTEVRAELDQCVLLCACCHNALHTGECRVEFGKCDGLGYTVVGGKGNEQKPFE